MKLPPARSVSATLLLLCAGCAAGGSPTALRTEPAPGAEQRATDLALGEQRRRDFQAVLLRLDQALDSYSKALAGGGAMRAGEQATRIERNLRDTVLDRGPAVVGKGATAPPPGENFRRLQAAAADGSDPHAQGIALAALGFAGTPEVMPLILQGAQLADPVLVDRAVFGLAILRAPNTPPGVLAAIAENTRLAEASRTQAAWALYRLQEVSDQREAIVAHWLRMLGAAAALPPGVVVQAVRGVGLARDVARAPLMASFLRHSVAMVRMAAADAIARMNAQAHAADLIALIGPEEPVPMVRLHARKALQELAGRADHGYDVAAWRKEFERK